MVNSRESLAKIPSMNNDANPYIITLDIYKEGYWAYDISNYYKGRVDDNGTPFMVRWFEHGQLKNVQGLRPFIRGTVGQHTIDDQTDPDNPKVVPSPDCSQIDQTGETTDTAPGGIAIYRMVNDCFTQEGMFYGEIGLKDSSGLVLSSVDIAFKVLGGRMNMIGARKFYVSEFEKALDNLNEIIEKTKKDFSQELKQVIDDARNTYNEQVKNSHDALMALDAQIQANRDEQENLNNHLISTDQKIAAGDVVTWATYNADQQKTTNLVKSQLSQITQIPEAVTNLNELKQKYPTGKAGIFVTMDDKHAYIWDNNQWTDNGPYVSNALPRSITESCPVNYMQIPLTKKMDNAYYDGQLQIKPVAGGAVYEPQQVRQRSNYRVVTKLSGQAHIILQDNNGNIKTWGQNPDGSTVYDIYTEDFTKIYICTTDNSVVGNYPRLYGIPELIPANSSYEKQNFSFILDNGIVKSNFETDENFEITELFKPSEILDAKVASDGSNHVNLVFCDQNGNIIDYKQKNFKEIFTTKDLISSKKITYVCFSGYNPQFTLLPGTPHRGFPITNVNGQDYLKNGLNYQLVDNKVIAVKKDDQNYEISEVFKPDEISQLSYTSSGGNYIGLIFLDKNKRLVGYKQKEHLQSFTMDDLTLDKPFTYVSFAGYDFNFQLVGNPPHRGFPDLSQNCATVILEFDNEEDDFYKSRFDLVKQYGFPFSFAIESTFRTDGFVNEANFKNYQDMINFGCDPMIYGGIGPNPTPSTATVDDWNAYIGVWLNWCDQHGLYCPVYACSLNDLPDNLVAALKSRGYKHARTVPYWANNSKNFDKSQFRLPTLALDNTDSSLDNLKKDIENAIQNNETVSVLSHLIGGTEDYQVSTETYTLFLKWLKEKADNGDVKVTTYSDWLAGTPEMSNVQSKRLQYAYSHQAAWPWTAPAQPTSPQAQAVEPKKDSDK